MIRDKEWISQPNLCFVLNSSVYTPTSLGSVFSSMFSCTVCRTPVLTGWQSTSLGQRSMYFTIMKVSHPIILSVSDLLQQKFQCQRSGSVILSSKLPPWYGFSTTLSTSKIPAFGLLKILEPLLTLFAQRDCWITRCNWAGFFSRMRLEFFVTLPNRFI